MHVFLIVVILPAVLAVAGFLGVGPAEPPEGDLRFWFDTNRSTFERLRVLLDQPPRITFIDLESDSAGVGDGAIGPVDFREPRLAELRSIMRWIGAADVRNDGQRGDLRCWMSPGGFRGQSTKGFAFGPRDDGPVLRSVDDPGRSKYFDGRTERVYSKLGGDWYVFFDSGS